MLNEQVFEFGQTRLKLKDGLRFSLRENGASNDEIVYTIEDSLSGKFMQIGFTEYVFLSLLDGRFTVNEIMEQTSSLLEKHALDDLQVAKLCKWAVDADLVAKNPSRDKRRAEDEVERSQTRLSRLNPITWRLPLGSPDAFYDRLESSLGWIVSPAFGVVWFVAMFYGVFLLAMNWGQFWTERITVVVAGDLWWFVATWIGLRFIHESAHAIVCKRFRGNVNSCGLLFLLFVPLPFVDVSDSWRFENKWQRILTSAAGMIAELFIASIAVWVWASAEPGPIQYYAANVIIAASVQTLLFNANPLMRFDGYYILSDWLEIPNLSSQGRQYVKGFFKRIYFGGRPAAINETGLRRWVIVVYGFLSIGWFMLITVGLTIGAFGLLSGFGLLLAVIGVVLWFGVPVLRMLRYLAIGTEFERPNRVRFAATSLATLGAVVGLLVFCPGPAAVTAPLVLQYQNLSLVRSQVSGFVEKVHVVDGQQVSEGQLLVTLRNPSLRNELTAVQLDIEITSLRAKIQLNGGNVAAVDLERESLEALHKRERELTELIRRLEVRAKHAGKVLRLEIESLTETYLNRGDDLFSLAPSNEVNAIALARQEDLRWLKEGTPVRLQVWGHKEESTVVGRVALVNPKARKELAHEAFAASNGGPLPVITNHDDQGDDPQSGLILTEPRVEVEISLAPDVRGEFLSGQTGVMLLNSRRQNLATYVAENLSRFIVDNTPRTHGF